MMFERLIKIYQLSKRAFGGHKRIIVFLTLLGFLNSSLAGIGVNTLIPIFSIVSGKGDILGTDVITKQIRNLFSFFGLAFSLKFLLIFVCLLFIAQSVIIFFSNYFIATVTANYEYRLRNILFSKTVKAAWPYLLKLKGGYLETVIVNDVRAGTNVLSGVSGLIIALTSILVYLAVAFSISFQVTVFTFFFGLFYLFLTRPLLSRTKKTGIKTTGAFKEVSNFINENVSGVKSVKVFSAESSIIEIAKKKFLLLRDLRNRIALLGALGGVLVQPLSILFVGAVFVFFYKSSAFNIGAFLALVYLIQKIFSYFVQFQSILQKTIEVVPYLQSALSYEDRAMEFKEEVGGTKNFIFGKGLFLDKINFFYSGNNKILKDISFDLKKGEVVGLIGPSGAGKTTIVDLILRLFQPTAGKIMLNGVDIGDINIKEWRNKIGYVSQDMFLINDTIENNIKFYNDSLSMADIESASRMADIYDFIMSRPGGFKASVGERGNLLSVGQRQRIVIARVLARKPEILILDEATSALDNESEIEIQRVTNNLKGKVSVLVIAHRLSTITNCDRLVALSQGAVIEEGTPEALLRQKDSYFYKVHNF